MEDTFYKSHAWRSVRGQAIKLYGKTCMCCGIPVDGVDLHVDHIRPKSKYPHLSLKLSNLQILCSSCNYEKSNLHETDYRPTTSQKILEWRQQEHTTSIPTKKTEGQLEWERVNNENPKPIDNIVSQVEWAKRTKHKNKHIRKN